MKTGSKMMLVAVLAGSLATGALAQVRLVTANPSMGAVGGAGSWSNCRLKIHTENVGASASRSVTVHYNTGGGWTTGTATLANEYAAHSTWSFSIPHSTAEFALQFDSDAGTFYDNNGGANYSVTPGIGSSIDAGAVGGCVGMDKAVRSPNSSMPRLFNDLEVTIVAQDLSYWGCTVVDCGIRLTTDGWATYGDYSASYVRTRGTYVSTSNIDEYVVDIAKLPAGAMYEFAVYYVLTDAGGALFEMWDNNFGAGNNYRIPRLFLGAWTID